MHIYTEGKYMSAAEVKDIKTWAVDECNRLAQKDMNGDLTTNEEYEWSSALLFVLAQEVTGRKQVHCMTVFVSVFVCPVNEKSVSANVWIHALMCVYVYVLVCVCVCVYISNWMCVYADHDLFVRVR